jgi:hypothetical protein
MRFYTLSGLNWTVSLTCIALIVSIIGSALQAAKYRFVSSLEACSTYDDSSTYNSCGTDYYNGTLYSSSSFRCTGDSDYFAEAVVCEVSITVQLIRHRYHIITRWRVAVDVVWNSRSTT